MPSKTFKRHWEQLATGYYPEGFIMGLKKALNARAFRQAFPDNSYQKRTGMSDDEIEQLLSRIQAINPLIVEPQTAKGLAWLRNRWKTPIGRERKHNPFDHEQQMVIENLKEFRLIDFAPIQANSFLDYWLPVYEARAHNGHSFAYYATPWQSGGGITFWD